MGCEVAIDLELRQRAEGDLRRDDATALFAVVDQVERGHHVVLASGELRQHCAGGAFVDGLAEDRLLVAVSDDDDRVRSQDRVGGRGAFGDGPGLLRREPPRERVRRLVLERRLVDVGGHHRERNARQRQQLAAPWRCRCKE